MFSRLVHYPLILDSMCRKVREAEAGSFIVGYFYSVIIGHKMSYCQYAINIIGRKKAVKYKFLENEEIPSYPFCTKTVNMIASIVTIPRMQSVLFRLFICDENKTKVNAGTKSIAEIPASTRW